MENNLLPMVANLPSMADVSSSKSTKVVDNSESAYDASTSESESVTKRPFKDVLKAREAKENADARNEIDKEEKEEPSEGVAAPQVTETRPVITQVAETTSKMVPEAATQVAEQAVAVDVGAAEVLTPVLNATAEVSEVVDIAETAGKATTQVEKELPLVATSLAENAGKQTEKLAKPVDFDQALASAEGKATESLVKVAEKPVQLDTNSQLSQQPDDAALKANAEQITEIKDLKINQVQVESKQSLKVEQSDEGKTGKIDNDVFRVNAQNVGVVNSAATQSMSQVIEPARLSETQTLNMVNQVQTQIQSSMGKGKTDFSFTLSPPELGEVKIHFTYRADGVEVALQASSGATNDLLSRHLNELRNSLAESGINVANLNVESEGQQGNQSFSFQQWQEQRENAPQMADIPWSDDFETETGYQAQTVYSSSAQVNYFV